MGEELIPRNGLKGATPSDNAPMDKLLFVTTLLGECPHLHNACGVDGRGAPRFSVGGAEPGAQRRLNTKFALNPARTLRAPFKKDTHG